MSKVILMSIVFVSVVVPMVLATRKKARQALRRAQWITIAFVFVWATACLAWYPQLVPLE
jgi:hypothetical protein